MAEDLWRALSMAELYVADLDAIQEGGASGRVRPWGGGGGGVG